RPVELALRALVHRGQDVLIRQPSDALWHCRVPVEVHVDPIHLRAQRLQHLRQEPRACWDGGKRRQGLGAGLGHCDSSFPPPERVTVAVVFCGLQTASPTNLPPPWYVIPAAEVIAMSTSSLLSALFWRNSWSPRTSSMSRTTPSRDHGTRVLM